MIKRCIDRDKEGLISSDTQNRADNKKIEVLFSQSQSLLSPLSCLCVCWRGLVAGLILVGKQETVQKFCLIFSHLSWFFFFMFSPHQQCKRRLWSWFCWLWKMDLLCHGRSWFSLWFRGWSHDFLRLLKLALGMLSSSFTEPPASRYEEDSSWRFHSALKTTVFQFSLSCNVKCA